jgi:hypothetical protein
MSIRSLKWIMLGPVLVLSLLSQGYSAEWMLPPPGQPEQMRSKVDYDPKLVDTFFKSNERGYRLGGRVLPDKRNVPEGEDPRGLKLTAQCFSTSHSTEHEVRFCEAKLLDVNRIDLFIHEPNPEFVDYLRLRIADGMFTSQYWTGYKIGYRMPAGTTPWIWTTTRQELTLDKKAYRKGDVLKGRIDFECVQEATNPKYIEKHGKSPITIKLYGVFKTTIE